MRSKYCFIYCGPERCDCQNEDDELFPFGLPVEPEAPRRPLVVNLFGGPGAGKTTMAAGLFYKLKRAGYKVEYSHEYAKELHFSGRMLGAASLQDQIYIFAKQRSRLEQLIPHSDIIICDGPILLGGLYYPELYPDSFRELLLWAHTQHWSVSYMLERVHEYQPIGRRQTAEESDEIGRKMKTFFMKSNVPFHTAEGSDEGLENVFNAVVNLRTGK